MALAAGPNVSDGATTVYWRGATSAKGAMRLCPNSWVLIQDRITTTTTTRTHNGIQAPTIPVFGRTQPHRLGAECEAT